MEVTKTNPPFLNLPSPILPFDVLRLIFANLKRKDQLVQLLVCKALATSFKASVPPYMTSYASYKTYKLISIVYYLQHRGFMHAPPDAIPMRDGWNDTMHAGTAGILRSDYEDMLQDFYSPLDVPFLGYKNEPRASPKYSWVESREELKNPALRVVIPPPDIPVTRRGDTYAYSYSHIITDRYNHDIGYFAAGKSQVAQRIIRHDKKYGYTGVRDLGPFNVAYGNERYSFPIGMDAESISILKCCFIAGKTSQFKLGIKLLRVLQHGKVTFVAPPIYYELFAGKSENQAQLVGVLSAHVEFLTGLLRSKTAEGDRIFIELDGDADTGDRRLLGPSPWHEQLTNVITAAIVASDRVDMVLLMTMRCESLHKWLPWALINNSHNIIKHLSSPRSLPKMLSDVPNEIIYGTPRSREFIEKFLNKKLTAHQIPQGVETSASLAKLEGIPISEHGRYIRLDYHDIKDCVRERFGSYTDVERIAFVEYILIRLEAKACTAHLDSKVFDCREDRVYIKYFDQHVDRVYRKTLIRDVMCLMIDALANYGLQVNVVYWIYALVVCDVKTYVVDYLQKRRYSLFNVDSHKQIQCELLDHNAFNRLAQSAFDRNGINALCAIARISELTEAALIGAISSYSLPRTRHSAWYNLVTLPWRSDLGPACFRV
jgi:hypothetical protein